LHTDTRARVDEHVGDVDDEVRDQNTGDEEEEDALDEEVVAVLDRSQGQASEPRIGEDDLDDDRARHDRAECEREAGDLGKQGVPVGVLANKLRRRAQRRQVVRVVGLELVDDHVPHPDSPAPERHQEER
jgi:hypothetical protein